MIALLAGDPGRIVWLQYEPCSKKVGCWRLRVLSLKSGRQTAIAERWADDEAMPHALAVAGRRALLLTTAGSNTTTWGKLAVADLNQGRVKTLFTYDYPKAGDYEQPPPQIASDGNVAVYTDGLVLRRLDSHGTKPLARLDALPKSVAIRGQTVAVFIPSRPDSLHPTEDALPLLPAKLELRSLHDGHLVNSIELKSAGVDWYSAALTSAHLVVTSTERIDIYGLRSAQIERSLTVRAGIEAAAADATHVVFRTYDEQVWLLDPADGPPKRLASTSGSAGCGAVPAIAGRYVVWSEDLPHLHGCRIRAATIGG